MTSRILGTSILMMAMIGSGCSGDNGADGAAGADGMSCTVVEDGSGGATIECDDGTSVTVSSGTDGAACTVVDNGDGTKTITCDDGTTATVADGTDVDPTTLEDLLGRLDEAANVDPEGCAICHGHAGEEHQEIYDMYTDTSDLGLSIDGVTVTGSGPYTYVVDFSITKGGRPFIDADGLPSLTQKTFYAVTYNSTTMTFGDGGSTESQSLTPSSGGTWHSNGDGTYTTTRTGVAFDITAGNGHVYGYIADGLLDTESGGHVNMYDNVASDAMTYGTATTTPYVSLANVSGCERCHGTPYMKHGYRDPVVAGLGDFASCKSCHYDTRTGGHVDWQIIVDDPARYAEIHEGSAITTEERTRYAYTANLMNDVHMAHAMEFPYPQRMANCTTCHEGHLTELLDDSNFVVGTCVSCHAWSGDATYGTRELSLHGIWESHGVEAFHGGAGSLWATPAAATACNTCHVASGAAGGARLSSLHNGGYDSMIYTAGGTERYSDVFTAAIDAASFDSGTNTLTVELSAQEVGGASTVAGLDVDDIVPTVMVGLYGYDTKDFIVAAHGRDDMMNRLLEFPLDGSTNPRLTVVSSAAGAWEIDIDLSMWATMITDDVIRRAEISVMPGLTVVVGEADTSVGTCTPECSRGSYCNSSDTCVENDDYMVGLNAPSRTFDLGANAFDDDFYNDIVEIDGCNNCHDQLATTFHSGNRGGNIRVCRTCHVGLSGGSHLEMQSRSIDSYAHAIHSFQAFDPGDIDFTDPVEQFRYDLHIEHVFPNFTIKNCESCHEPGTYNPPDQSRSMPGLLSGSDDVAGRAIQNVPAVVTGPGARACGACHRSHEINEDNAAGLQGLYDHWRTNGYVVENGDGVLDTVIDTVMSVFY